MNFQIGFRIAFPNIHFHHVEYGMRTLRRQNCSSYTKKNIQGTLVATSLTLYLVCTKRFWNNILMDTTILWTNLI
jgi:hypothetical protein